MNSKHLLAFPLLASVLFLLTFCGNTGQTGNTVKPVLNPDEPGVTCVTNCYLFVFSPAAGNAVTVAITGDFLNWSKKGKMLTYNSNSRNWSIALTLDPGVYQYVYIINGTNYSHDPGAMANVPDKTYGQISIIEVKEP